MARVPRRETEADRLRSIESDVAMLKRRITASPLPEEQRSLVREVIVKQSWPFRSVVIALGVLGAAGGELVAGGAPGAALGAAAGLALPLIFEEPLVTRLSRRRERKVRAKMTVGEDPMSTPFPGLSEDEALG